MTDENKSVEDEIKTIEDAAEFMGVNKNATEDEITDAFRKKTLQFHSDKSKGSDEKQRKLLESRAILRLKKNEIDVVSQISKEVISQINIRDSNRIKLEIEKTKKIKKLNTDILKKNIPRLMIPVIALIIINGMRDFILTADVGLSGSIGTMMVVLTQLISLGAILFWMVYLIRKIIRNRNDELAKIDEEFETQIFDLMG